VDECKENPCHQMCINTDGGYRCTCRIGYVLQLDNTTCLDIDECALSMRFEGGNFCPQEDMECLNTEGSFKCMMPCEKGFKRNIQGQCEDVNECVTGDHNCGEFLLCLNVEGGFRCQCPRGFRKSMPDRICIDVDECTEVGVRVCQQRCQNTMGAYKCSCNQGFYLAYDQVNCERNVSELIKPTKGQVLTTRPSTTRKQMISTVGGSDGLSKETVIPKTTSKSILVTDKPSTSVPLTTIRSIVSTSSEQQCAKWYQKFCDWKCVASNGHNECFCPAGYRRLYNGRCHDRNECLTHNDCSTSQKCFNTKGSYKCVDYSCPQDYKQIFKGGCEKTCTISPQFGFCRRFYVFYYTLSLTKNTKTGKVLLRLKANENVVRDMSKAHFYIYNNSNYKLRSFTDRAELLTNRYFRFSGENNVIVVSDIFDSKDRMVCRTKFHIYVDVSQYEF